jgi:PKD repeat protein
MLHLGTDGRNRKEVITPGGIASGQGDDYLVALNRAIAEWAKAIYIRPMAEMNNAGTLYSGYKSNGQPKGASYAPETYRKAFARIYVILHGGSLEAVNGRLGRLGLPPVRGGELLPNPSPMLRVLWSPLASDAPRVSGNAAARYYPGAAYVDVEGGDIYDERLTDTAPWDGLEALFKAARGHGKPFSVPEWGLFGVDDAAFVQHMCSFAKTHPATEMLAFYESRAAGTFDLQPKPRSRAAYRKCVTPLAGSLPAWAVGNATGAGPELLALTLTPTPAAGPAPLAVQFGIDAELSVPIQHWQLFFGDGTSTDGAGAPPLTVEHAYPQDGIFQATLLVYPSPPFSPESAQFFVSATVTVGTGANPPVSFKATPAQPPLAVSFQTDLGPTVAPTHWTIAFADGNRAEGNGAPPHFTGHTYPQDGTYHVLLVLDAAAGSRYLAAVDVTVTTAAPPNGTPTGTVLVNGAAFAGGPVPYGSQIDVTNGTLQFTTDTGTLLVYGDGVAASFVVLRGTDNGKVIVELRLTGGDFRACPRRTSAAVGAAPPKTTIRQLWGKGKGRFRTRGRYAAAAVRGTTWLTADRCDGTLVKVSDGTVQVRDFVKRKAVTVRRGKSYLAKKR